MAIYTKGGDKGNTSLFDGKRVPKNSLRVETYGTFDELNANVSLADKFCLDPENRKILQRIEYRMFFLQGEIATEEPEKFRQQSTIITDEDVHYLESIIDKYTAELPKVTTFILPGSSCAGAQLHVCRTVCRRAERQFVSFMAENDVRPELERYVNRLSDFFYIMARSEDHVAENQKILDMVVERYKKATEES
ncbi:cobalamin adenosyltransferase [Secundilactobacillus paracollinoides]|uniref:Corrinoid adenosyltransferase n=1 Tax=Secundilactobacillus paracollinoides TaxID=240427 RepID=A0A1B2IYN4_9LACO|nr:cob(I)yrinic acid a,c-diamide adenosyltransferase [Secundilactobacillus paracollinoides]ANZ61196.1 cobalamin adenosyltransferase [Secundilactobacillus paracollinoides]ANZ64410.1 cobalamin adenosyltransferase [Secundilactobacillus paracollinoides]ANZ67118.1 cobalamin adenosyltransferase [Secundilactobacillus paracollinoides]KRL76118.1 pduo protein [Secundilactobacillus paracollinoides DSM 15502 = JCM 11969]